VGSVSFLDLVVTLVVIAVLIGMLVAAMRMEPHWVSRDGRRFISKAQLVDDHGRTTSRWIEYRFRITEDGEVEARRRSILGGRNRGVWEVRYRATDAPRRKAVFLLYPRREAGSLLAVRLPARSRAVPILDELAEN